MKKSRKLLSKIKRSKIVGLPPGSMVQMSEVKTTPSVVNAFKYDSEHFNEHRLTAADIAILKPPTKGKLWLNVHGVQDAELLKQRLKGSASINT